MTLLEVRVRETAQRHDPYDYGEPHVESERAKDEESADIRDGISADELDAEAMIHQRISPRKRAVRVALALLCVLVVAGLFHYAVTPVATGQPTLTPFAHTSRSQVAIVSNLSFGSVEVNGKQLVGNPPFLFSAAPGGNTVVYLAPPFSPQTCHVFWYGSGVSSQLGAGGSTCEMGSETVRVTSWVSTSYVLTFQFGLDNLPQALQQTARDFVRQTITPASLSLAVPNGQYYATGRDGRGMIVSRQATTPLTALVSVLPPTPQDLADSVAWCTELICPALGISLVQASTPALMDQFWVVQIPLVMRWQFLLPDGRRVGAEYQSQVGLDITVGFALDPQQQWHLAQFISPARLLKEQQQMIPASLCSTGINELSSALQNEQAGDLELDSGTDRGLAGCEIRIIRTDGTLTGSVVWRLGVLLAADAQTHTAYPWLPLAPQNEVAAVSGV